MSLLFSYAGSPAQIVFGRGEWSRAGEFMHKLGCSRALVLSTPFQRPQAEQIMEKLGNLAVDLFDGAAMHTPVNVTDKAVSLAEKTDADCIVAFGGGSTIGLGKAIAYRTDLPQIVIPTTYAGSEATPILGQTENGAKITVRDAKILPEVVIYDPDLSMTLPVPMSIVSGLNAMAHAAEALYATDRNPISTLMAVEGLHALRDALPTIVQTPRDVKAREEALYGAWLCGTVLGTVGMALHHKICHTLGGSFDMPHAETHAVMLPHTVGFNAVSVPDLLKPISDLFGGPPGAALFDFAARIGAPLGLKQIGFKREDIDRAAEIATKTPYPNPRTIDRDRIAALLQQAFTGDRPQS